MSAIRGRATVFGFPGTISWTGRAHLAEQNSDHRQEAEEVLVRDKDNSAMSAAVSGRVQHATLRFAPLASSDGQTIATVRGGLTAPTLGAIVTIADMGAGVDGADWFFNGNWRLAYTNNGVPTYELDITRLVDANSAQIVA